MANVTCNNTTVTVFEDYKVSKPVDDGIPPMDDEYVDKTNITAEHCIEFLNFNEMCLVDKTNLNTTIQNMDIPSFEIIIKTVVKHKVADVTIIKAAMYLIFCIFQSKANCEKNFTRETEIPFSLKQSMMQPIPDKETFDKFKFIELCNQNFRLYFISCLEIANKIFHDRPFNAYSLFTVTKMDQDVENLRFYNKVTWSVLNVLRFGVHIRPEHIRYIDYKILEYYASLNQ